MKTIYNDLVKVRNPETGAFEGLPGFLQEPGLMFDLLWKNPSPSSDFPAQTIKLDLSNYQAVYIFYKLLPNSTDAAYGSKLIYIDDSPSWIAITENYYDSGNLVSRLVVVTKTGIQFYTPVKSGSNNNSVMKPYKIYGVKSSAYTDPNRLAKVFYEGKNLHVLGQVIPDGTYAYFTTPLYSTPKSITINTVSIGGVGYITDATVDRISDGLFVIKSSQLSSRGNNLVEAEVTFNW